MTQDDLRPSVTIYDHLRPSKTVKDQSLVPPSKGKKYRQMKLKKMNLYELK